MLLSVRQAFHCVWRLELSSYCSYHVLVHLPCESGPLSALPLGLCTGGATQTTTKTCPQVRAAAQTNDQTTECVWSSNCRCSTGCSPRDQRSNPRRPFPPRSPTMMPRKSDALARPAYGAQAHAATPTLYASLRRPAPLPPSSEHRPGTSPRLGEQRVHTPPPPLRLVEKWRWHGRFSPLAKRWRGCWWALGISGAGAELGGC